ncbi:chemotaxis protein CheA [Arabiibacter massiliensis]|uniref:chemotaxis protein CheA n=1 Tax=Arabiibacter massiliensis TaxID=1870985 RepID=UPI0009B968B1|nr:chemotaxis protein CheA [Arabiibacter massiliensis]
MERDELIVQVMLKPNCGLENTRASLVVRRITPLCDAVSCHPRTVKSDPATISFLRDHGLFIRFSSATPEQVLLAIKGSFFVDRCTIVEDPDAIPAYEAAGADADGEGDTAFALPSSFSHSDELGRRSAELTGLLARFEEVHRALRAHLDDAPNDRGLSAIVFSHAQVVDGLRTAVMRSRIEPFDRIAPSLRTLVSDYGYRFGVLADLEIADGHLALDRSVLASMEGVIKRVMRACLRDGIEKPETRTAAGKPPRATVRLRLESDGSDVICRIEHDGRPFDARAIGEQAVERGLLARPLSTYTDEELGAFLLLPGFVTAGTSHTSSMFAQFNEVGSLLQHAGGRGEVRNTERGTLEISLRFPVPFTVMEAAVLRAGGTRFALPAQQIERFEAYRPERVERAGAGAASGEADAVSSATVSASAFYVGDDGARYALLGEPGGSSPFEAESPTFSLLLDAPGAKRALVVDAVDGYERLSVNRLPALLDRREAREAGCIGYALLQNGEPCPVVSARLLAGAALKGGGGHARP